MRHVQLEEADAFAVVGERIVCLTDGLDGLRARGGEAVGEVELAGYTGDGKFAGVVVDFVDANWGEADGGVDRVAPDRVGCVAGVGVDEHTGDDAVAVERLAVGGVGVGLSVVESSVMLLWVGVFNASELYSSAKSKVASTMEWIDK